MTNYSKGFAATSGARLATGVPWGTPHGTALGANHGFAFVDEDMKVDSQLIPDEQVDGQVTEAEGDKGAELASGPRTMDVPYEGLDLLFGLAMGTEVAIAQVGVDDAYLHIFKPAKNKEGQFCTMVTNKQTHVEEYASCKVDGFAFTVKAKERARVQFPIIASGVHYNTTSAETVAGIAGINTLTSAANITLRANSYKYVLFRHMKVLINTQAGGTLTLGTDDVYVSEFSLNLNNNFAGDEISTRRGYQNDEPLQDGKSQFTGTLGFSRLSDESGGAYGLFTRNREKTKMKMKVEFTGEAIGATAFRLTFYLNNVQFTEQSSPVQGTKRLQPRYTFRASRAVAAPSGFPTGYTDPVTMEIVNQINAALLS